jgi:hypothetical protein
MFGAFQADFEFLVQLPENEPAGADHFGHIVHLGTGLALHPVVDAQDREIGYLIGLAAEQALGHAIPGPAPGQCCGEWTRGLAGPFFCYLADASGCGGAFFSDAAGSLGIVYDPARRALASAPDLLFFARLRRGPDLPDLAWQLQAARRNGGASPDAGPLRLPRNAALLSPELLVIREFAPGQGLARVA